MSVKQREEDRLRTWELSWNGVHWHDMPGDDSDHQKLNFCLWKRGLKEYELNEAGELREVAPRFGAVGVRATWSQAKTEAMRDRVAAVRERVKALCALGVTQAAMAREARVCETQLNKLVSGYRGMREEKMARLLAVVEQYESRREVLVAAKAARHAELVAANARVEVDASRWMRFGDWLAAEAQRRGVNVPVLRKALHAGTVPWPEGLWRVNARRWFVPKQSEAQARKPMLLDGKGVAA